MIRRPALAPGRRARSMWAAIDRLREQLADERNHSAALGRQLAESEHARHVQAAEHADQLRRYGHFHDQLSTAVRVGHSAGIPL